MKVEEAIPQKKEFYGSFWHFMRSRFDQLQGLLLTAVFTFISILTAITTSLYFGVGLFLLLCLFILIWTFYRSAEDLYYENKHLKLNKNKLPSVIEVRKMNIRDNGAIALCLLGPSDLFSYNALVTFYYCRRTYEQAIGFGEVVNIQDVNKIIQVELISVLEGHEELIEKLIQNNAHCLNRIRVKPIILKKYLNQMRRGDR